jgi:hypothetical protein
MEDFSNQFGEGNLVTICADCQKQQHIDLSKISDQGWKPSHGVCPRHFRRTMAMAGIPLEKIKAMKQPDTRDLSQPENKPLLDWFLNPPHAPGGVKKNEPIPNAGGEVSP